MVEPTCLEHTPCHDDRDDENECLVGGRKTELEMAELGFRRSASELKALQKTISSTRSSSMKLMCENVISCVNTECQLSKDLKRQNELENWAKSSIKGSSCEFVLSGYRSTKSWWECTNSVFRIHNETINIWTHLISGVVTTLFHPLCPLLGR